LPACVPGRPAGISFVQIVAALVNREEFWSILDGMLISTLESGKSCQRMQAAALR
jgi:hypothetical protein